MNIGSGISLAVLLSVALPALAAQDAAPQVLAPLPPEAVPATVPGMELLYEDELGAEAHVAPAAPQPGLQHARPAPAQPVPEPAGWVLLVAGLAALATLQRRRPPLFK